MTNRVAVITGATKGIGHGIAKRLIAAGVDVTAIYRHDGEAADRFRKEAKAMRWQGYGRIINIGASFKDYMKGTPGLGAFGVHKGALAIFTKTLALEEIANGITVNMVAPGSTRNAGAFPEEMRLPIGSIPLSRRVEIDEIAEAVM